MISKIIFALAIMCSFVIFYSCTAPHKDAYIYEDDELKIHKNDSMFHDFEIEGDYVYMRCSICVENLTDETQQFYITAQSKEDVKNGLIKGNVYAADRKHKMKLFSIPPRTELDGGKLLLDFTLIGKHGIGNMKYDRNLPYLMLFRI